MIEVELPDGSIAEFPDGTPETVIRTALLKRTQPDEAADPAAMEEFRKFASWATQNPGDAVNAEANRLATRREPELRRGSANAVSGRQDTSPKAVREAENSLGYDLWNSALTGLRQGAETMVGGLGSANQVNADALSWLAQQFGASPESAATFGDYSKLAMPGGMVAPTVETVQGATDPLLGEAYRPQTVGGEYMRTGMEFLPSMVFGRGRLAQKLLEQVAAPAVVSETAGQLTKGTRLEPYARMAGAVAGGVAPSAARRVATPLPISAERKALVDALKREGVDLTAGQASGRKGLQYLESKLGGAAGANFVERQGEQFTRAALKRAGVDADRVMPDVMHLALEQIGNRLDAVAARTTIKPDMQLGSDLLDTFRRFESRVPQSQQPGAVRTVMADIVTRVRNGKLDGSAYQSFRPRLDRLSQTSKSDPDISGAFRGIRDSLDDMVERSITDPDDFGMWREARRQHRNFPTLEQAAAAAGEKAGVISPFELRNAAASNQARRGYGRGPGDFGELALAGEALMKPLPGTSGRLAATVPPVVGRALLSGPARAYLGNQAFPGGSSKDELFLQAIIHALLSQQPDR